MDIKAYTEDYLANNPDILELLIPSLSHTTRFLIARSENVKLLWDVIRENQDVLDKILSLHGKYIVIVGDAIQLRAVTELAAHIFSYPDMSSSVMDDQLKDRLITASDVKTQLLLDNWLLPILIMFDLIED